MKFEVKVGQEFSLFTAEDRSSKVVIHLSQQQLSSNGLDASLPFWRSRAFRYSVVAATFFIAFVVAPSALYGMVSGDYSSLKSIADSGSELLRFGFQVIK